MATLTKGSALDAIAALGKTAPKAAKKDGKPILNDPSLNDSITAFIEARKNEETAKAQKEQAAQQITAAALPFRLAQCVSRRDVVASVGVNGRVTVVRDSRYKPVPEECSDQVAKVFGPDADRYFQATLKIALTEGAANNEAVLATMIDKLGPEFIAANFAIRRDLLVTPAFHSDYSTKPEVQEKAQPLIDDSVIQPYAPSVKIS